MCSSLVKENGFVFFCSTKKKQKTASYPKLTSHWIFSIQPSHFINKESPLNSFVELSPLKIYIHILHTVLYAFSKLLTRRICLIIKSFYSWWSIPWHLKWGQRVYLQLYQMEPNSRKNSHTSVLRIFIRI